MHIQPMLFAAMGFSLLAVLGSIMANPGFESRRLLRFTLVWFGIAAVLGIAAAGI